MLPVQIQNELRARKLQYYAELNKMNGDYAPIKYENLKEDLDAKKQREEELKRAEEEKMREQARLAEEERKRKEEEAKKIMLS